MYAEAIEDATRVKEEAAAEDDFINRVLQAAYLPGSVTKQAAATRLSRKQCRRSSKAVMHIQLKQQDDLLRRILDENPIILCSWERLEFDETKQRLALAAHPHLLQCQQVSSWSVQVAVHELGWVAPDAVVHVVNIVRLNKILVGAVTAGTVWSALMDGDEFDNTRGMLREFRDRS